MVKKKPRTGRERGWVSPKEAQTAKRTDNTGNAADPAKDDITEKAESSITGKKNNRNRKTSCQKSKAIENKRPKKETKNACF